MEPCNGNEITDDFVSSIRFVEHAWENQEQRLLNIKGNRFWVPDFVGERYDKFKIVDSDFAAEFALKWKRAWWYLKGFVRKSESEKLDEMEEKCKRIGQSLTLYLDRENPDNSVITGRDNGIRTDQIDFGVIRGKDLGARFEIIPVKIDEGKFGIICFDLFPISKRIKLTPFGILMVK